MGCKIDSEQEAGNGCKVTALQTNALLTETIMIMLII
jgi:hypothetical protein